MQQDKTLNKDCSHCATAGDAGEQAACEKECNKLIVEQVIDELVFNIPLPLPANCGQECGQVWDIEERKKCLAECRARG